MRKKIVRNEALREEKLNELEYEVIKKFITLRKRYGLTQKEMAEKSDVIRETIARIENQITSPQIKTLIKILEPLGYTVRIAQIPRVKK